MTPGPNAESPRFQAVKCNAEDIIAVAEAHGAQRISLCGSVARGEDHDGDAAAGVSESDIDFYAWDFRSGEDARARAEALVKAYTSILAPFNIDVRTWPCLPGFPLDDHERYRRDAIMLGALVE